jgi:hypothetical protein
MDRRYRPSDSRRKARKSPTRRETQKLRQPIRRRVRGVLPLNTFFEVDPRSEGQPPQFGRTAG